MKILLVDDDEMAQLVLKDALIEAGYEVETAANGLEALEVMQRGKCRLVVSDWEMPRMNGVEFCRAIRSGDFRGYTYFILLTSHDAPAQRVEGLRAGADDFVAKPFNTAEMLARIGTGERMLSLETRDVAIFALAKLAESRDPETGAHLDRVRGYCRLLAQQLGGTAQFRDEVTPEFTRLIYLTSPLHDIGKVGIPDCVLLKPGRLSDREFDIMKSHAMLGAQTLEAALQEFPEVKFLQMGRDIAASHHERFDGTGYPHRLRGFDIPLCGRIMALADVYDALTSKRVYKDAFAHDVARGIIVNESGTHFDPDIVQAFIQTEQQFIDIHNRYREAERAAA